MTKRALVSRIVIIFLVAITGTATFTSHTDAAANIKQDEYTDVPISRSWFGKFTGKDKASLYRLRAEKPPNDYITSSQKWAKLWKAWQGDKELPAVNFKDEIVVVFISDPKNSFSPRAMLDKNGDLTFSVITTLIAVQPTPEFSYCIAVIARNGIKTIAGQPIEEY